MALGPDELRSQWDRPCVDTESRSAEAFAWRDPGGSASLTSTERASARTSPITAAGGDQPTAADSMMEVEALALKGSLGGWCRWIPISLGAQCRWHREALKGLVTTGWTPRDIDAGPPLHPLRHAVRLRRWRWVHLSQGLPA